MSTIISNYPVFEKNQVLTESQLNQMVKYLDQQNRLTRVSLIGLGIVCGLDVLCESENTLTITKGVGVTSEGFLIQIGECVTTRYREYNKPGSISYPPFEDPITHDQDIDLIELLTEEAEVDPEETVNDLTEEVWNGKIVLLYLECFDKDLKSCIGKSCDELGIDRIFTLRKLLISKEDLAKVHARTSGGMPETQYQDKFKLPSMVIPRPLFSYKGPEAQTYYSMGVNYLGTIMNYADLIHSQLISTYDVYQPILEDIYGENPFTSANLAASIDDIKKYFEDFYGFTEPIYGVQYIYDFFKDLTVAYNEFKDQAFDLTAICCPDMSRFPKHLLLGEACVTIGECELSEFRHYFVASPVLNLQQERLERVKFLHKRLVLMVEYFSVNRIRETEEIEFKITPSDEKKGYLSQRTIPFYYDSKAESSFENLGTLEHTWNYELFKKCVPSDFPKQLSYDNHNFGQLHEDPITTPLGFDLDQFNFFRVEGIQGKPLKDVERSLLEYKFKANLSFDIKPVYFGDLIEEGFKATCAYSDLQPSYGIWRNKVLLFLNNLVKANRNVEKVVMNRGEIFESGVEGISSFGNTKANVGGDSPKEKRSSFGATGLKGGFDLKNLSGMMSMREIIDFDSAAGEISNINMKLGNIMSNADASRSATFESSRDTSIRGIFGDLNTCLQNLIQAMPNDFRKFSMEEWLKHYKCAMRMYISAMKFLASETNSAGAMLIIYLILIILCVLFRILRFISIYPYITIRILYDTAQERLERLQASYQFARFLRNHPGMDHKAGVAPGHTLVLVYQLEHLLDEKEDGLGGLNLDKFLKPGGIVDGESSFFKGDFEFQDPPAYEQIIEVASKMIDNVVADFTVPFICCDDCGDMPHTPVTLDPLATPICGIAQFIFGEKRDNDELPWDYKPVNIRILNDLYDPAVYKVRLPDGTDPNFGTYTFEKGIYDPDSSKEAQIFKYVVDEALLAEEIKVNDDFFIIDEFEYEIYDVRRDEVVDGDKISIFIPVISTGETTTGSLTGTVKVTQNNETFPVGNASVTVIQPKKTALTGDDGKYIIEDIQTGTYDIEARFEGFNIETKENFDIGTGENKLDFILTNAAAVDFNMGRTFRTMGIQANSADARKIQAYVNTQMSDYRATANKLVVEEGSKEVTPISKAQASVEIYATTKEISVVKLNNDFNERRNELIEGWDEASRKDKKMYAESLKNITGAYLDRLAHSQPDKLSKTTKETLKETANIYNSRPELGMKDTIGTWNKNAQGYMTEDYRENISNTLKLK